MTRGRKPRIDDSLELKIVRLIRAMSEREIPLKWDTLTIEIEKKYGHSITRQTLYANKKIKQELQTSKAYQTKLRQQTSQLPYKNLPREALRKKVAELQSLVEVLKDELSMVRSHQYDQLSAFSTLRLST